MNIEELKAKLIEIEESYYDRGEEQMHRKHDDLLLEFIDDPEVTGIFKRSTKWYE